MNDKVLSQLQRMLQKVFQKYPQTDEPSVMTDIHIRVNQETGDVMAYDDNDQEITRVVVDSWIDNTEDDKKFYSEAAKALRHLLMKPIPKANHGDSQKNFGESFGILMPYSFVLEDENGEHVDELFIADSDDTIIIGGPFMEGLSKDLDDFMKHLMED